MNLRCWLLITAVSVAAWRPGSLLMAEGDCSQAGTLMRDAAQKYPGSADHSKALAAYTEATTLCPSMAEAHFNRGIILMKMRDFDGGVSSLQKAYDLKPQPQFRAALATAQLEQGKLDEAREHFERLLEADPRSVKALQGLSVIAEKQSDTPRAISLLDRALAVAPDDLVTLFNLAVLREKSGDTQRAAELYEKVLKIDRMQERAAVRLAGIYLLSGRPADAQRLASLVLELNPKNLDALKINAALQSESDDQGKAILSLKRALEVEPKNEQTIVSLATLLLDQRSSQEALEVLKQGAARLPDSTAIMQLTGQAQMALGNFQDAEVSFKRALAINALDAEAHYNYSILLEQIGRKAEATEHRETAARLKPELADIE